MHGSLLYVLLFFLYLSLASAHLPVFPPPTSSSSPYELSSVTEKSYGVYGELAATDIVWLEMEGIKGEEMTVSLQRSEKRAVYDVAIWGEGLDSVTCGNKNWYGWAHSVGGHYFTRNLTELPAAVREAIGSSEAFVLHGDGLEDPEFEPFGVGLYWPLGGCKDSFPATATYKMALVNPKEELVAFSLGVGMVESFSLVDLLLMPFVIYRTFVWGGRSPEAVIGIFALSVLVFYAFRLMLLQTDSSYRAVGRRGLLTISLHTLWLCAGAFFASGVSFLFQLIICLTIKPNLGTIVLVPLFVHILLPIVFAFLIFFYYQPYGRWYIRLGAIAAGAYMLFFGWMAFLIFPALSILVVLVHWLS